MSIPTVERLVAIADEAGERAYAQKRSLTRIAEIRAEAIRDAMLDGIITTTKEFDGYKIVVMRPDAGGDEAAFLEPLDAQMVVAWLRGFVG